MKKLAILMLFFFCSQAFPLQMPSVFSKSESENVQTIIDELMQAEDQMEGLSTTEKVLIYKYARSVARKNKLIHTMRAIGLYIEDLKSELSPLYPEKIPTSRSISPLALLSEDEAKDHTDDTISDMEDLDAECAALEKEISEDSPEQRQSTRLFGKKETTTLLREEASFYDKMHPKEIVDRLLYEEDHSWKFSLRELYEKFRRRWRLMVDFAASQHAIDLIHGIIRRMEFELEDIEGKDVVSGIVQQVKIVFTGAPCSGKSTIVEKLAEYGYDTVPEAATIIIKEEIARAVPDLEKVLPWVQGMRDKFQQNVLQQQLIMQRSKFDARYLVMDRSALDGLAYYIVDDIAIPPDILHRSSLRGHVIAFLPDTLPPVDTEYRRDNDRAEKIKQILKVIYRTSHIDLIPIPVMSIPDRMRYVSAFVPRLNMKAIAYHRYMA